MAHDERPDERNLDAETGDPGPPLPREGTEASGPPAGVPVDEALAAAADEVPDSDSGPGEGIAPDPAAAAVPAEGQRAGAVNSREESVRTEDEPVVPGAHLEPDLVLDQPGTPAEGEEYGDYAAAGETDDAAAPQPQPAASERAREAPVRRTPMDLAADARYRATGKRKTSVARVILRPGSGAYRVNGRPLEAYFPRVGLQKQVQQPLETAGYASRMDVVAKIHGGGVSSQAGALRHGVARALVEADPNLRTELKRRGFLTRDARATERKKAGLKKARKRPQFSKR